tara:strand:- start:803 stop:1981 length:1179 start_codon:yes stop_codon:yes gene_type:complete
MARKLKDWISAYMQYVDNTEPPDQYKMWVAISTIASVLQRKCYLDWGPMVFYPNMYIVLCGPSGKARKSTAMGPGMKMLRTLGVKLAAESVTREALIRELKNSNATQVDPDDGSMHLHASLTVVSPELTVFLGYNNSALLSDLTDWYDCRDRWTYRTKNMGTDDIVGVWVNLIGATTPELLQTTMPRDAIGGGLTSRIIFVYEEKKGKIVPAPFLSPEEVELREWLVTDLEKIGMLSGEFKITKKFLDKWIEWYTAQEDNPPFKDLRFSGYIERRPNHVLKLCIILSASEGDSKVITDKHLDRALKILGKTEKKMPYTFSGVGKMETADVMARVMATIATNGTMTFSSLLETYYYDADQDTLQKILATLSAMKYCTLKYNSKECIITYNKKP